MDSKEKETKCQKNSGVVKTCFVEKIVSKVIIIACDHLLVSKIPKKRRKNEENRLFSPKPGFRQSWTKVLRTVLQYAYFSVISRFPHKTVTHFRNSLAVLPPPTLYKVETRKKFWIHSSNIICGVRGGVVPRLLSTIVVTQWFMLVC